VEIGGLADRGWHPDLAASWLSPRIAALLRFLRPFRRFLTIDLSRLPAS